MSSSIPSTSLVAEVIKVLDFGTITFSVSIFLVVSALFAVIILMRKNFKNETSSFLRRHRNNSGLFPISEVEEQRRFKPDKKMGAKEQILLTMLQDKNADNNPPVNFVITDPDFIDNPIIYASDGFCAFTGYHKKEIEQRNCRFLQGSDTDKEEVAKIRRAIDEERDETVELLNYKKDGTPFRNRFFLCPLYKPDRKIAYYLGVQLDITNEEHDDIHENAGARLFGWLQ